ncbi:alpha/beta fold hydrolase [Larkinella insperata]|uniref:Alpha/beta fold hydrolase n=1 Tax=Larkinella insperata TaxID=332158 RepID=A0ABW3Q7A3_9BACT|nr:alpha/beta hydrolase [Larkinella insperata]
MKNLLVYFLLVVSASAWAQTNREPLFTSFDGTKIHYEVAGEGRPVVLVHGFMGNSTSWQKAVLRQSLLDAGYKVVQLDLRGNGQSDKPHTLAAYQNDAEARDIIALMNHLKLNHYDVVGYSRGSIITARLLVLDPNLRSAVLGGMGADFTDPDWPRRRAFADLFSGKAHLHPEFQGALNAAKTRGLDTLSLGFQQQAQPSTSPAELSKARIPVLIICGEQDEDNGRAGDLAKLIPTATLKTVPGNHNNTSGSDGFAREVLAFLRSSK